jgi:hypothetical protein
LVAVDGDPRGAEGLLAADAQDRAEVDGQIPRPRAEAQVAEVGDPGDAPALVHQHVVEREVAVHDLRGKEVAARQDTLLVSVEHALDDLPPAGFGDGCDEWTEARRLTRVPEEIAPGRRVEEPA